MKHAGAPPWAGRSDVDGWTGSGHLPTTSNGGKRMPGHVFIVRGDLRKLACDAWLIPTSRKARPGTEWFLPGYAGPRQGPPFADAGPQVQPLVGPAPGRPQPWLGLVGMWGQPVSWYADGAAEFLDAAAAAIAAAGAPPLFGRARSLLAIPVVGTGR